jgi:predicted DNA-binding transcriptional regulator AlpA
MEANEEIKRFIGIREVCEIAGFSKSSILRKIKAGAFPLPVIREGNVTRWDCAECMAWREAQFIKRAERQQTQAAQRVNSG